MGLEKELWNTSFKRRSCNSLDDHHLPVESEVIELCAVGTPECLGTPAVRNLAFVLKIRK
jgi:hypothetical protein